MISYVGDWFDDQFWLGCQQFFEAKIDGVWQCPAPQGKAIARVSHPVGIGSRNSGNDRQGEAAQPLTHLSFERHFSIPTLKSPSETARFFKKFTQTIYRVRKILRILDQS
jgi:hypothetical protein